MHSQISFAFPTPVAACVPGFGLAKSFVTAHEWDFTGEKPTISLPWLTGQISAVDSLEI